MKIIDITRTLEDSTAVWPGDSPFELRSTRQRGKGESVNLTVLKMSAHTGTHVDAPIHFTDEGKAIAELALDPFWGPAQVVTVEAAAGPLFPADFEEIDLSLAPRLLVRSDASIISPSTFPERYVYPSVELVDLLGRKGIILYGSDAPSMDAENSKSLAGHQALHRNHIAILEWLDLSNAPDGLYELVALPLKIAEGDGSPVRAALKG